MKSLIDAAAEVDVLEVAGRIIANPSRANPSLAAQLALAHSVENLWHVCLEADGMVAALDRAADAKPDERETLRSKSLTHAAEVKARMAALTGQTQKDQ